MLSELRRVIWPIEGKEHKKFLPMALILFFIMFNYLVLQSVKDTLVINKLGIQAMLSIKSFVSAPSAFAMLIIYLVLCNIMGQQKIFYIVISFFIACITFFTFVIYPNPETEFSNAGFVAFYVIAELWGSVVLGLLFWQFANQITKIEEAKRFYLLLGALGGLSYLLSGYITDLPLTGNHAGIAPKELNVLALLIATIFIGLLIMLTYKWIVNNVLTDPDQVTPAWERVKSSGLKLSVINSVKLLFTSKSLGLIFVVLAARSVSATMVGTIFKSTVRDMYTSVEQYSGFMADLAWWQRLCMVIFTIIAINILRKLSWRVSAMVTPIIVLITGSVFFALIFLGKVFPSYLAWLISGGVLLLLVRAGMVHDILTKATTNTLFYATKEISYISLDDEERIKGKALVDTFGSVAGSVLSAAFFAVPFTLLPNLTINDIAPYCAVVFFAMMIVWIYSARALGREYNRLSNNK